MTGTSLDGIDISLIKTNGVELKRLGQNFYHKYDDKTRNYLLSILQKNRPVSVKEQNLLNKIITNEHIKSLRNLNILEKCDYIGFHGQTVYHNPGNFTSIQVGDPFILGRNLQKNIIYDFRTKDIELGGQGAPLAPIFHKYLIKSLNLMKPACILNIGGVSNLTYWDGKKLLGFDTGPGNALMDNYSRKISKNFFDINGEIAFKGKADKNLVKKFLKNNYFHTPPPKSLDRNTFTNFYMELLKKNLSIFDTMATLAEFTVESILFSFKFLPKEVKSILVSGGGYKNKYLITNLRKKLNVNFYLEKDLPFDLDYVEAELIAFISARSLYNLPITFPSTTGTSIPTSGGKIFIYKNPC